MVGLATASELVNSIGRSTSLEVLIRTTLMFALAAFNTTATVRPLKFASCAALLVVTPVPTVTSHNVYAFRVAFCAVSDNAADAVPVPAPKAANVVFPHPRVLMDPRVPNPNVGRASVILSAASRGAFRANTNDMDDACCATGFDIVSALCCTAGVGCVTAGETAMADPAMSIADARVTPTVLVVVFAACALTLVVTPDSICTLHCDPATSVAVTACKVNVAVDAPEFVAEAVKVVDPQPVDVVGVDIVPKLNVGSTSVISSAASNGTFILNESESDDSDDVCGSLYCQYTAAHH